MVLNGGEVLTLLDQFFGGNPYAKEEALRRLSTEVNEDPNSLVRTILSVDQEPRTYKLLGAIIHLFWHRLNDRTRSALKKFFISGFFSEEHLLSYKVQSNLLAVASINESVCYGVFNAAYVLLPIGEFTELNEAIFKHLILDSQMGRLSSCFLLHRLIPVVPDLYSSSFHILDQMMDSLMFDASREHDPPHIAIDLKIPFWACRVRIQLLSRFATARDRPTLSAALTRVSHVLGRSFREFRSDILVGLLLRDLMSLAGEKPWLFESGFGGFMKLIIKTCAKYVRENDHVLETHHTVVTYNTIVRSLFFVAVVARGSPQAVTPHVRKLTNYFVKLSRCDDLYVRRITLSILFPLGLVASEETDPLRQLHHTVSASTGGFLTDTYVQDGRMIERTYEGIPDSLSGM